jgi:hypothetical protein
VNGLGVLPPSLQPVPRILPLDTKEPDWKKDGSTVHLNLALAVLAIHSIEDLASDHTGLAQLSNETSFTTEQVNIGNLPRPIIRTHNPRYLGIAAASSQIWNIAFATLRELLINNINNTQNVPLTLRHTFLKSLSLRTWTRHCQADPFPLSNIYIRFRNDMTYKVDPNAEYALDRLHEHQLERLDITPYHQSDRVLIHLGNGRKGRQQLCVSAGLMVRGYIVSLKGVSLSLSALLRSQLVTLRLLTLFLKAVRFAIFMVLPLDF